jgi:hypothetical protein
MQPMAACMDQGGNDDSLGYGIKLVTLTASVNRSFIDMRALSNPQPASVSPDGSLSLTPA